MSLKVPKVEGPEFERWLRSELFKLGRPIEQPEVNFLHLRVQHKELNKPRQGMIAYADGTDWNPGSGEGVYRYDGTSWAYLG